MRRTFEYRLKPNQGQALQLEAQLGACRRLYNAMLEQRQRAYKETGKSPTRFQQELELKGVRTMPEYAAINAHVLQDVARRLDLAFQAFFRRVKAGEEPGYPRFRSKDRYDSMTWNEVSKTCIKDSHVSLSKAPSDLRFIQHRPLRGVAKTATIKHRAGKWFVLFSCDDVPADQTLVKGQGSVGVDVGLTTFATLSTGEEIQNPRYAKKAAARLRFAQRILARRVKGSSRRRKQRAIVARQHENVRCQRRDHAFKTARSLVQRFEFIAVENLQVKDMLGNHRLARAISDASWASFTSILQAKAEEAGSVVALVNPRGTSQDCSKCGTKVPKGLWVRTHACQACGFTLGRDHNAALNILERGRNGPSWRPAYERAVEARSPAL